MDSSHSQHHNISPTNKRKRGRPRKDEVVGSTDTSPHMSPPQKKPIGRPRKDGCIRPSNTKSHSTSVQQKRPVGRPKKVHINPIDNNRKTATGQSEPLTMTKTTSCHGTSSGPNAKLCTLLPRLPNQYLSSLKNSLVQAPYSSQLTRGIGHSCDDNRNGVIGTSSRHSKDTLSFDDVSYSESHEYVEGIGHSCGVIGASSSLSSFDDISGFESQEYAEDDIIYGNDGQDFDNSEDMIDGDTMSQTHQALHVIEFQKHGLPDAHMVIWLHSDSKPKTIQQVDAMVSAEIPNRDQDPDGYNAVKQFMIHGPCGTLDNSSPCMDVERKVCTRHFPKRYNSETCFDDSGFPVYRRRKSNHTVEKNGVALDNQWVVPYNRDLLVMFQCHINVEICNHSRSLKYLFKYCMKGHDRATMLLVKAKQRAQAIAQPSQIPEVDKVDEIKQYLDGRYVCAVEAVWRIYGFSIHHRTPSVERLPIHLEDMQTITFNSNESLTSVEKCASFRLSKLQAWFQANKKYPWARNLYYQEFPASFVWDANSCQWTPRKQGFVVGRLNCTYASSGDLFYLRMILTRFKGAMSFKDLRIVNGQVHRTFKDTCNALGLLQNDMEWHEAIQENSHYATASQLRQLFVHIIVNYEVSNPSKLWGDHIKDFSDDIIWMRRRALKNDELILSEEEIHNWALAEVERILNCIGKSSQSYADMPFPLPEFLCGISNTLIAEERSYDIPTMIVEHQKLHSSFNADQMVIYNAVIESINNKRGKVFFVHGSGGCGKTFLWRTIISRMRSERKFVLPVASSGIAAVLMPGGRTAHSRFKIPLDVDEHSSCGLKMGTDIAELLQNTELIIWDEAPMQKKYAFEALDRALRDILGCISEDNRLKPFGGITVVFGGDFRQILPVVEKGNRHDIVSACINRSYLWDQVILFTLNQNMRLHRSNSDEVNNAINEFSKWVLDIGEGQISFIDDNDPNKDPEVVIPEQFIIRSTNNPLTDIVDLIYPNLETNFKDHQYLRDRAILAPTNKVVDGINDNIMDRIPGEEHIYLSVDSFDEGPVDESDLNSAFPEEFFNTIDMPGLPKHKLKLKVGAVVMLTRNVNQVFGLCNGTRMVVKKLFKMDN